MDLISKTSNSGYCQTKKSEESLYLIYTLLLYYKSHCVLFSNEVHCYLDKFMRKLIDYPKKWIFAC